MWWSSTVPVLSFPLRGAWLAQDAQPQHTAPMAMLSPLSPTAAVDSPGCAPMVPGLSLGLGGRHVSLRQSVLWLRGAPALQSRCLPLPATGTGLPALYHAVLHCGTARPTLPLQAAMEVPVPPVHIHMFAAGDPNSCACLAGLLSGRTGAVSVLSRVAVWPHPVAGPGTTPLADYSSQAWGREAGQCPRPGLVATHEAEQAARAARRTSAGPCPLHRPQRRSEASAQPPCRWREEGVSTAPWEHTPTLPGSPRSPR